MREVDVSDQHCPECGKQFDRPASLGAHRRVAHGIAGTSRPGSTVLGGANQSLWSGWSTGRHASVAPRSGDPEVIDREAVHSAAKSGVAEDSCPECGKQFDRPASLGAHRRAAHGVAGTSRPSRRVTGGANQSRWSGWSTGRHPSVAPRPDDPHVIDRGEVQTAEELAISELRCPECGKQFDRPASLGAHRRLGHGVAGTSRASGKSAARRETPPPGSGAAAPGADRRVVDRDALLQQLFPNGLPARASVIQRVNLWLDEADRLAGLE
jgi:uncharacterized C2H2 Zn-finger protein